MPDAFQQIRTALAPWASLNDAQWETLAAIFRVREVRAGEHLLLPGDATHEWLFISEGLLRFFYVADDGTESNKAFLAEGAFAGSLAAAVLGLPVVYGIQALEPTVVLAARYADFVALYEVDPVFERLGRRFAELLLMRKELRTRSLLQQNAAERYRSFVAQHPELVQRVPQYHIASYLGISEVHLSRLRRAMAETTAAS